jgi:Predicted hydrolases of the HAD superfamily
LNKKYFFFDIDGTLTDRDDGMVVPSAKEAIQKLQAAGHFVSIATGRAYYKADHFRKDNGFAHMVCNGGHGIVYDGVLRENRPLVYEHAKAVYDQALALGYGVYAAIDDSNKVYANSFLFHEQAGMRKEPSVYIIDKDFDPSIAGTIYKMYISIPPEEEEKLTTKSLLGHLRFEKEYLMFQPDEKRDGILRMLEYAGGQVEDVIVFGDDYNDLIMFDDRFYKVAMGNGCDALKEKADYIAPKNVEDGIYKTCEAHGWFL